MFWGVFLTQIVRPLSPPLPVPFSTNMFGILPWVSISGSMKTGNETFGEVLQIEAAKNKSLKIDHAALQRVMNLDGSFKQIGGERSGNGWGGARMGGEELAVLLQ